MISIQKQTLLLALVLAVIVISSTLSGYLIFSRYYQTAESRFESNAEIALSNGSHAIRGLLRFYQGILDTLATNHQVKDLLAFGEIEEIVAWTQATANKLPGALGTALANIDGKVIGGLKIQRVGDKCQKDLHDFAIGQQFSYPPVHRQIPELEHFDLAAPLKGLDDETKGILFISFRLTLLQGLLDDLVNGDRQRFSLYSGNDLISISSNRFKDGIELRTFEMDIPDSTWRLKLEIPEPDGLLFHYAMFMVAACSIMLTALTVYLVLRRVTQSISFDIVSIHQAMTSVLEGNYQPGNTQTQLRETAHLIADIDHVATQLQTRQRQLEKDNTTDPLTGLINRRHFDLMLEHDFVQSERGSHSYLLLIDLNDFKQVNDNHGHIVGDEVL